MESLNISLMSNVISLIYISISKTKHSRENIMDVPLPPFLLHASIILGHNQKCTIYHCNSAFDMPFLYHSFLICMNFGHSSNLWTCSFDFCMMSVYSLVKSSNQPS